MKIYKLSELGKRVSSNTNAQPNSHWMVIYALRNLGYSTPDQLAIYTGLSEGEVTASLGILRRKGIVEEK